MGKSKKISSLCVYCGTFDDVKTSIPAVKLGRVELFVKNSKVLKEIEQVQEDAKVPYMVEVCPACGTVIGVIYSID